MGKNRIDKMLAEMAKSRALRVATTRNSFFWFFHYYFHGYIKYPTADFQKEIISIAENENISNFFCVAFRGSAKSTLITTAYVLWAILGKQQKKCVIVASQTSQQSKMHLLNIKRELENNQLLKNDLGPFREENSPWGMSMLVFPQYDAMIIPLSTEQSIRGNRFGPHRPDLIIGDDLEDDASVRTQESRDKTYGWLTNEVIPAGDKNTRLIIIGNLLHEDSILMRLKKEVENGNLRDAIFKKYPIIENGKIAWPGKFPTMKDIENERKRIGDEYSWCKEYLLQIISRDGQVVLSEWITFYDTLPDNKSCYRGIFVGVDPAVGQDTRSDCTAMVVGLLYKVDDDEYLYVLPNPINKRMMFPEILETIKELNASLNKIYDYIIFAIESISAQEYIAQAIDPLEINFVPIKPHSDKQTRLATISHLIQSKKILFPNQGAELLLRQMLHLGMETHDDLVDAFTMMVHEAVKEMQKPEPGIDFISNF